LDADERRRTPTAQEKVGVQRRLGLAGFRSPKGALRAVCFFRHPESNVLGRLALQCCFG
jgi:hypothetical protein